MESSETCPVENGYVIYRKKMIKLPRLYADVLANRDRAYWDYENFVVDWQSPDGIELVVKVGRGKYSEVYEAVRRAEDGTEETCIVKILKPVKSKKLRREISILHNLRGGPNIVRLLHPVKDQQSGVPSLVTEHVKAVDFRTLFPKLSDLDIRFYFFQLLVALDYCHSAGIIHRDVKPHNIMIDPERKVLRLIDWGLAEYYHPGKLYNVRVASRYYKPPELLVDLCAYDYSMDMWSAGCVLASMIFYKEAFFTGADNLNQLEKIVEVLGFAEFEKYMRKYNLEYPAGFSISLMKSKKRIPWTNFINPMTRSTANPEAIELLDKLLRYDHTERLLPSEAMQLSYFDPVRSASA